MYMNNFHLYSATLRRLYIVYLSTILSHTWTQTATLRHEWNEKRIRTQQQRES